MGFKLFKMLFSVTFYEQYVSNSMLFVVLHHSELLMQSFHWFADWVRNKSPSVTGNWEMSFEPVDLSCGVKLLGTPDPSLIFFLRDFGSSYKRKAFLRMKMEIFFGVASKSPLFNLFPHKVIETNSANKHALICPSA